MKHVPAPEPYRTDIIRRLAALPAEPREPTGAVLVWAVVFFLLWAAAIAFVWFLFWMRATP